MASREALDRRQPEIVAAVGGEGVVGRRERVVGDAHRVALGIRARARAPAGEGDDRRHSRTLRPTAPETCDGAGQPGCAEEPTRGRSSASEWCPANTNTNA